MQKLLSALLLLASFSAFAQDEYPNTGSIGIHGTDPKTVVANDSSVGLVKSAQGFRQVTIGATTKAVWLNNAKAQGFIQPATGSAPDDSIFNFRSAGNQLYKRVIPDGVINMEWIPTLTPNSTGAATTNRLALQHFFDMIPSGAHVRVSDSSIYYLDSMVQIHKTCYIEGVGKRVVFQQVSNFATIFYVDHDSVEFHNIAFVGTNTGDEVNFPQGYGAAIIYRRVTHGIVVRDCTFTNFGDWSSPGTLAGDTSSRGGAKSGAGIYLTLCANAKIEHNYFNQCIYMVGVDGYQNKNIGTPGSIDVFNNNISWNEGYKCPFGIAVDHLDSTAGLNNFPGTFSHNKIIMPSGVTINGGGTIGIKMTTRFSTRPADVAFNDIEGYSTGIAALSGSYFINVHDNTLDSNYTHYSAFTQNGGQTDRRQNVHNNFFLNSRGPAVIITGGFDLYFTENWYFQNQTGVLLQNQPVGIHFDKEHILSSQRNAFQIESGYGVWITGTDMYDNGTDLVNGDTAAIIVNKGGANATYNLNITGNYFDRVTNGNTPTLTQTYAFKSFGAYGASNQYAAPGWFKDNYLGRTIVQESLLETAFGIKYRNNTTTQRRDTTMANAFQIIWSKNPVNSNNDTLVDFKYQPTGQLQIVPRLKGGTPLGIVDSSAHIITGLTTAQGGLAANATVSSGNLYYPGSTGVFTSTASNDTAMGQATAAAHGRSVGTTTGALTGSIPGFSWIFSRPDWTVNSALVPFAGGPVFNSPTLNAASTQAPVTMGNMIVNGLPTGGTARNAGIYLYKSNIGAFNFPYTTAPGKQVVVTSDSTWAYADNPAAMTRQYITGSTSGSQTLSSTNRILVFNPSALIASYTVTTPASPADQSKFVILGSGLGGSIANGSAVVTSFTLAANSGQSLIYSSAPTTILSGTRIEGTWDPTLNAWFIKVY
jgi:hypothetical protein